MSQRLVNPTDFPDQKYLEIKELDVEVHVLPKISRGRNSFVMFCITHRIHVEYIW